MYSYSPALLFLNTNTENITNFNENEGLLSTSHTHLFDYLLYYALECFRYLITACKHPEQIQFGIVFVLVWLKEKNVYLKCINI